MRLLRPLFISISACKGLGLVSARPFPQGGETTAVEPIPSSVASTPTAAPLTISRLIATGSQVLPFASFQYGATGGPNTTLLFSGPVTLTASEVTLTLTEGFSPTTQTYPATTVTRNQTVVYVLGPSTLVELQVLPSGIEAQAICQSSNESVVNCAQYLYDNGTAFDTQTYAYTGTTGAAFTAVAQITSGDPALSITQYAMPTGTTAVLPSRRGVLAVLPEPTAALAA